MNSDTNNNDKLAHNIGITFAVFTAIVIFFCVFNMFHRDEDPSSPPINGPTGGPNPVIATVVHQSNGLDNDATSSSPYNPHQFAYSEIRARGIKGSYASACSICLAEYEEADLIRLLPSCGHLFHVKCIDPWLILHPTCPICRNPPSTNTPQLAPAN